MMTQSYMVILVIWLSVFNICSTEKIEVFFMTPSYMVILVIWLCANIGNYSKRENRKIMILSYMVILVIWLYVFDMGKYTFIIKKENEKHDNLKLYGYIGYLVI